jgi:hypothetical protein
MRNGFDLTLVAHLWASKVKFQSKTKFMRKLLSMLALGSMAIAFVACEDDVVPDTPTITSPSITNVQVENEADITFNVTVPGGYKTVAVSGSGGTVTKKSEPALGSVSGTVVVTFLADATAGAGSATITVTDNNNKIATQTGVVNKTAEPQKPVVEVFASESGVGTTTWTSGNIYVLRGFIFVNDGQTLTIEPGTVIKGQPGDGAGASALIVSRGGIIDAEGESDNPIIFTALADDTDDPEDLPLNTRGQWGGLILLGKAPINHSAGETVIEGLPETDDRGVYGNGTPNDFTTGVDDNSGVVAYVSVRHGGTEIGAGNEINGLTMGGVGRGTTIHHIEVWGNDDDGFEWFGGTVNTSYLASMYNQDDAFDWDFGWRGQNQFWLAYQQPDFAGSDRGMELDGAHSGNLSATVFSEPTVFNMTLVGALNTGSGANCIYMTEGSGGYIRNSIVTNFRAGINLVTTGDPGNKILDRLNAGKLDFDNNIFFSIGAFTTVAEVASGTSDAPTRAALETNLAAGNNTFADPQLAGIAEGSFDPLPAAAGPAFEDLFTVPAAPVDGFTYETVTHKGAFGATNWLLGWTAAFEYGVAE